MTIELNDKAISTDNDGFLIDPYQWKPDVASVMASIDSVTLTETHWEVIRFLRDYYTVYEIAPDDRILIKSLSKRLGASKGSKAYIAALFPGTPAETACRYAGLPKPIRGGCV
jgi:tRNA 2-thiouridine synthesizing protein E